MKQPLDLLILSPHSVRDRGVPLRRFLDVALLPEGGCIRHEAALWFQNDETIEKEFFYRPDPIPRRVLRTLAFLVKHRKALRNAGAIYCLDGVCFQILLTLSHARLFRPGGKSIRRYAFHDKTLTQMTGRLRNAHPAFQIEMITRDQVKSGRAALGEGRVLHREWKIDLDWFVPAAQALDAKRHMLCPGIARRCEEMLPHLLDLMPGQHLIRASRRARGIKHPRCDQRVNLSHPEYLQLMQSASCVLLPIEVCDEPAGLTAAMEAIATERPIIANKSLGISELFAECEYPVPMVQDLSPASWAAAILELQQQMQQESFRAALSRARARLAVKHAILPGAGDWMEILREVKSTVATP